MELESSLADNMTSNHTLGDNQFIWTYTSPVFPMLQVSCTMKMRVFYCIFSFILSNHSTKVKLEIHLLVFFSSTHHQFIYVILVLG